MPVPAAGNTLQQVQAQAVARLAISAQSATARRDAELLLLHVCHLSRAQLLTHPETPITQAQLEAYFQAIERRAQSEPIQYITGMQEFYGLAFQVTPAVLIPRPETEHLVEEAILIAGKQAAPLRILDIGTGSGAIAVSLAHALPSAQCVATDISAAALEVARVNAAQHCVADRIAFIECDLLPPHPGIFDLVCSNPPYIAAFELLEPQVAAFEPHLALFAGATGFEIYQRLIPMAVRVLRPGGSLLLELGHGQQARIESLLAASFMQNPHFVKDLQGIPRVARSEKI